MFAAKKSLSRRTILRGVGAGVALPLLDAMFPAFTPQAKAAAKPSLRFGTIYVPNGAIMPQFTPKTAGTGFEFTTILKPLEPYKDSLVVVTNLTRSHPGSQVGDHAVSAAVGRREDWLRRARRIRGGHAVVYGATRRGSAPGRLGPGDDGFGRR